MDRGRVERGKSREGEASITTQHSIIINECIQETTPHTQHMYSIAMYPVQCMESLQGPGDTWQVSNMC